MAKPIYTFSLVSESVMLVWKLNKKAHAYDPNTWGLRQEDYES